MPQVQVLLFSVLREKVGCAEVSFALPPLATAEDLVEKLAQQYPVIRDYLGVTRIAVNQEYAPADTVLAEADEVALITPVSGG